MTPRRLLASLACVAALLATTACGGSVHHSAASESGAPLITANALVYASLDSDLSSSQWQQVDELLKKFPDHDKWIRQLKESLKNEDPPLDYDRDLKDALGPEVDLAVVGGAEQGSKPAFAVLTKPDSIDKARELVRKENAAHPDDKGVTRDVDGWLVISDSEASLDRVLKGSNGGALADEGLFNDALGSLPDDALAKVYVNGRQLGALFGSFMPFANLASYDTSSSSLDWIAAALAADGDGFRFQAGLNGSAASSGTAYSSKLIAGVPADALAFATFHGGTAGSQLDQLRSNPLFAGMLQQLERELGMSLDRVLGLFGGEVAFYVRRGPGIPELSLVLEEQDTQAALATIDQLAARAAALMHAQVRSELQDGVTVKSLALSRVTLHWAGFDGRVLLTTGPTGIADYRAGADKLADDAAYKAALAAADVPDKTIGLLYLDLQGLVPLVQSYVGLAGGSIPSDAQANLKPLRSFVAYGTTSGDLTKIAAFLQLK
jgi:hypothetical protein